MTAAIVSKINDHPEPSKKTMEELEKINSSICEHKKTSKERHTVLEKRLSKFLYRLIGAMITIGVFIIGGNYAVTRDQINDNRTAFLLVLDNHEERIDRLENNFTLLLNNMEE